MHALLYWPWEETLTKNENNDMILNSETNDSATEH